MKRLVSALAVAAVGAVFWMPVESAAQGISVTGNIAITSDYTFRGISQTLEEPAVQGGFDLAFPVGAYAGVWGSSVNFGEDLANGDRAQMELDLYGGIAPTIAGFSLNGGLFYYAYPGAASSRSYNFLEVIGRVSRAVGPVTPLLTVAYSPDFFAASGAALYTGADLSAALPGAPVSLAGGLGYQKIEENSTFGTPDYLSWSVGASVGVMGATVRASVVGTDLDADDCFAGMDLCKTRVVVGISRTL